MSAKHTPGPWRIASAEGCAPMVIKPGVHDICTMAGSSANESVMADARLIAAAPELLEALEDLFGADMAHVLMGDGKPDQIAALIKARAAVAKATGEQS